MNNFEEFLRQEYNSMNASLIENEQLGERRVQFLISLAGALITAGGLLSFSGIISISEIPNNSGDDKSVNLKLETFAIVMSLLLLLIIPFGFITLIRVINRNSYTDYFAWRLNKIRTYYVRTENDKNKEYLAFNPYTKDPDTKDVIPIDDCPKARNLSYNPKKFFGKGGIVPTVILLNTILVAILLSILAGVIIPIFFLNSYPNLWSSFLGFVIGWVGFWLLQTFRHNNLSKKFSDELCHKFQ